MRRFIVAALVAALFVSGCSYAWAAERMPALFRYVKLDSRIAALPCGDLVRVDFYASPGMEEAPLWKLMAVFLPNQARASLMFVADDETNESSGWILYVDLDTDGVVDRTEVITGDDAGAAKACQALHP